jgi:outer membrane receptor protein involved in Fe transport
MYTLTTWVSAAACALACTSFACAQVVTIPAAPASAASSPVTQLNRVEVKSTRQRLDTARNSLSPSTGAAVYRFSQDDINALPLGNATPLNQVLLRAPGVVGNSYGQLHVRGDHANVQYRINGVVIPESISGFGAALDTRFANQINLLTGALPAQYGLRTAGVVDIQTRGADLPNAGMLELQLGSQQHREASGSIGGTSGDTGKNWQYFVVGSFLENQLGIENPTPERHAVHDTTRQTKGFAYLSRLVGDSSRVNLMLGYAHNRFQIPNVPGVTPSFEVTDTAVSESQHLNARQQERHTFQVLSLQSSLDAGVIAGVDYQLSLFNRSTALRYEPDAVGDLAYTGVAADVTRKNVATGLQLDASWALHPQHTLRAGLMGQRERASVSNSSSVFAADDDGQVTSTTPFTVVDKANLRGTTLGAYVQDEWRPTRALTLNGGLRYDWVDTTVRESQLSPRLGVTYQWSDNTRLHAGYARYFTPPPSEKIDTTSVQKFLNTSNALPSDANTAVRSERSDYFGLGASHQLTPQITLGLDGYWRDVRHLHDEGQFGNALIYSTFNFEKAHIYGLELSASYKNSRLSGYVNLGLSSAQGKGIESGQFNFEADELDYINQNWVNLDHAQKITTSVGASYQLTPHTTLGVDALYGSGLRRGFANTQRMPGHTQANASISHHVKFDASGAWELRFSVLNLLDRSSAIRDGSGIGVGAAQYAPRRAFYVSLNKPFAF